MSRARDQYQQDKAKFDKIVSRAALKVEDLIGKRESATVIQEAMEEYAHAKVSCCQFKVAIGCIVYRPREELFALNWDYMRKNKIALYDYVARMATTNATPASSAAFDALFDDEDYNSSDGPDFEYEFPTEEEMQREHWNEESDEDTEMADQDGVVNGKAELGELDQGLGEMEMEKEIEDEEDLFFDILEVEADEDEGDEESVDEEADEAVGKDN